MLELRPSESDRTFLRRLIYIILAAGLLLFLWRTSDLILLAFGALLGALLLTSITRALQRGVGAPRWLALSVAMLIMLGAIGLLFWLFGEETVRQLDALGRQLPGDVARLQSRLEADPLGGMVVSAAEEGGWVTTVANRTALLGMGLLQVIANLLIILVGALFFAAQPDLYVRGLVMLVPHRQRALAADAVEDVGEALRLWLLTQLISMTMMGTMIGIGLWLSGVDASLALGVLGGLGEFIPYVGPTLAMIPAVIVALVGKGSLWGVLLTYLIVRIVQANVITPLITHRVVSIPPGLYLFLILAMGFAFGWFGMFFAGALAVASYTLVIRLYSRGALGDPVPVPGEK